MKLDPQFWKGYALGSIWGFVIGWFMNWIRLMLKHGRRL